MSDWFTPYRYLDGELRQREPLDSLEALAKDIHVWRRYRRCRSVVCTDHQQAFDNPEGRRAVVLVEIKDVAGGVVIESRLCLTAGEDAEELRAELLGQHTATSTNPARRSRTQEAA